MIKNNFFKIFVLFFILLLITSCVKNKTYNINYISSYGDLSNVIKILKDNNIKFIVLGNGSNIVINDREYDNRWCATR